MRTNRVKTLAKGGHHAFGTMIFSFCSPNVPRLAAAAGADFVIFDQENSGFGIDAVRSLLDSARYHDMTTIVRVVEPRRDTISTVLDVGAEGVMVPMVDTAEQARGIVDWVRYPPRGRRGYGLLYRDEWPSADISETMRMAEDETFVIAQIESPAGTRVSYDIAAVDGIDCIFVGLNDLCSLMGIPGRLWHPRMDDAVRQIKTACAQNHKPMGTMVNTVEEGLRRLEQGFSVIAYSGDTVLYREALRSGLSALRG
jgi:2-keto-3-deoxy-L-rhamnonate aldolase RhmA